MSNYSNKRFENAREKCFSHERFNIGTYKEKTGHLFLKYYYEPDTSYHEINICGHIADICRDNTVIEIQTAAFGNLFKKIPSYLENYNLKIVYPCYIKYRIARIDKKEGSIVFGKYRIYNKKVYNILPELLRISEHIKSSKLSLDIVYMCATDYRSESISKRHKEEKVDIVPDEIISIYSINSVDDIEKLCSLDKDRIYTIADFEKHFGLKRRNLWMSIKLLENIGIIEEIDKKGRIKQYKVKQGAKK